MSAATGGPSGTAANSLPILAKSWKPLASKCRIIRRHELTCSTTLGERYDICQIRSHLPVLPTAS